MRLDGRIALADATAVGFTLAYYFSGRLCRCTLVGPLHWGILLLMASLWPIIFLGGSAHALSWTHCISEYSSRWLRFAPLFLCKQLPIHLSAPIPCSNLPAPAFLFSHYFSLSSSHHPH